MKFSASLILALSGAAAAKNLKASDKTASPVERVVNLLKDLQSKVENDGTVEQQIYDKYACWCETTTARKAAAIEKAQEDIRALGQSILKFKALVNVRTAEIAELEAAIKANKKEQADATKVRENENAAYQEETTEMKQAIAALQRATQVLVAGATQPALLQSNAELLVKAGASVSQFLQVMPENVMLKAEHVALLQHFAEDSRRYAPQSATIQGILKDMYETFVTDLESAVTAESTANRDFESFIAIKTEELNEMEATKAKKTEEKVEAEANLADATQQYDDTTAQMQADTEFFDATKEACSAKHEEWVNRDKLREEELAGIKEALEILTSDDARELFAKSIQPGQGANQVSAADVPPALLQVASDDSTSVASSKAYAALKAKASATHSLRLAMLAAQVREAKAGHFDAVIKAIDEMMVTLKEEGAADIAKRDQCKEEYLNTDSRTADLEWKIKNNIAKIDKLQGLIDKNTAEKEETIALIEETQKHIEELLATRTAENQAFLQAKADDEGAIELLTAAKEALSKFYTNNDVKMGEIQGSVKLLQKKEEPVFEVSEDQAPDAEFSGKGKRKNESKGILSILTMIIEDLGDEIKQGQKDEESQQLEYEKQDKAAKELKADLEEKKENLETEIARLGEEKTDEEGVKATNEEDLSDEKAYRAKITPDCDWIIGAFKEREQKRAAEMAGLTTAKEHLVTSTTEIVQNSLLQQAKPHVFDDEAFSKIKFLGVRN